MRIKKSIICMTVTVLCLAGCQTPPPQPKPTPAPVVRQQPPSAPLPPPAVVQRPRPTQPPPKKQPQERKRTPEQMQMLSDFAMKESPKIWQTIQTMRAEMVESGKKIKQLRADLLEFDRNPDADDDYKALVAGNQELKRAYDAIFDKLENAYIAAKKYEASPSRQDYQDTMLRALEDGIQDANMATERYKVMTRQK